MPNNKNEISFTYTVHHHKQIVEIADLVHCNAVRKTRFCKPCHHTRLMYRHCIPWWQSTHVIYEINYIYYSKPLYLSGKTRTEQRTVHNFCSAHIHNIYHSPSFSDNSVVCT